MNGNRRAFLKSAAGVAAFAASARSQTRPPNVVLVMCDDLGYGDLSCYGSSISTPYLDRMAGEGVRFTQFCSASSVCSPARAALLTGRYPTRMGIPRVIDPADQFGIPDSETTLAQMLKGAGYATMCVGKWHLGSTPQYLPTNRGFDEFYGIPYSIDQGARPLMYNTDVIEEPARLDTLTQRYTQTAVDFINRSKDRPFFLYMPHSFPHLPLAVSSKFAGCSFQGLYGDVVQEIDWSVGQVLQAIQANDLDSNTLVMFTSDHGPWFQGSPGGLRGRKGESYEGGFRVPFLARYPGWIPAGQVCQNFASSMDVLPTVATMTGAPLPANALDGVDMGPLLAGQNTELARDVYLYFNDVYVQAARAGDWKVHLARFNSLPFSAAPAGGRVNVPIHPELYNLPMDRDECHDRADRNPAVVSDMRARIDALMQTFPDDIVQAWNDQKAKPMSGTPAGCSPVAPAPV